MKIAVTSQNRREITEHAGRSRNFWVFDVEDGRIAGRNLLELPKGIEAVVTPEKDPDRAVSLWLTHSLACAEPHAHAQGADHGLDHDHDHEGGRSCGGGCDCA